MTKSNHSLAKAESLLPAGLVVDVRRGTRIRCRWNAGKTWRKNYGLWMFMVDIHSGKRLHSELENHHLE